jgi:hypothetical protein
LIRGGKIIFDFCDAFGLSVELIKLTLPLGMSKSTDGGQFRIRIILQSTSKIDHIPCLFHRKLPHHRGVRRARNGFHLFPKEHAGVHLQEYAVPIRPCWRATCAIGLPLFERRRTSSCTDCPAGRPPCLAHQLPGAGASTPSPCSSANEIAPRGIGR